MKGNEQGSEREREENEKRGREREFVELLLHVDVTREQELQGLHVRCCTERPTDVSAQWFVEFSSYNTPWTLHSLSSRLLPLAPYFCINTRWFVAPIAPGMAYGYNIPSYDPYNLYIIYISIVL